MRAAAVALGFAFTFVNAHIIDSESHQSKILVDLAQARSDHSSNTTLRRGWAETIVDYNPPNEILLKFLFAKLQFWDKDIVPYLKKVAENFGLGVEASTSILELQIMQNSTSTLTSH